MLFLEAAKRCLGSGKIKIFLWILMIAKHMLAKLVHRNPVEGQTHTHNCLCWSSTVCDIYGIESGGKSNTGFWHPLCLAG